MAESMTKGPEEDEPSQTVVSNSEADAAESKQETSNGVANNDSDTGGEREQGTEGVSDTVADAESEEPYGLITPSGDINWDCPCLQGMAQGPCGEQFKTAFSCFHYSESDPKGSDCIEQFRNMQECFEGHPEFYAASDDETSSPAADGEDIDPSGEGTPSATDETDTTNAVPAVEQTEGTSAVVTQPEADGPAKDETTSSTASPNATVAS